MHPAPRRRRSALRDGERNLRIDDGMQLSFASARVSHFSSIGPPKLEERRRETCGSTMGCS
jgi:hypothetical protein